MFEIKDSHIINFLQKKNIDTQEKVFSYFMNLKGITYREVKSRSTLKIVINNHNYFIKQHRPISFKEIIKNILNLKNPFATAVAEYNAINRLKALKINTLDVAGVAESGFFNTKSFILSKSIEPNFELDKLCSNFINHNKYFRLKRNVIEVIAKHTRVMHLNGLNHRDYYLCHYLYNNESKGIDQLKKQLDLPSKGCGDVMLNNLADNIHLIDLHRMQIRTNVPKRYQIKDLVALLFSVRNLKLTNTDKIRFIKHYMNFTDNAKFKRFMQNELTFWRTINKKSLLLREKG